MASEQKIISCVRLSDQMTSETDSLATIANLTVRQQTQYVTLLMLNGFSWKRIGASETVDTYR